MSTEFVTEVMVLPTGADLEADWENVRHYRLLVKWYGNVQPNGQGGYGVTDSFQSLSRALNWGYPERFQRGQYRWATLEEALAAARSVVDAYVVGWCTFAQWQAHLAGLAAAEQDAEPNRDGKCPAVFAIDKSQVCDGAAGHADGHTWIRDEVWIRMPARD